MRLCRHARRPRDEYAQRRGDHEKTMHGQSFRFVLLHFNTYQFPRSTKTDAG
jgi:hypothetical protein